MQNQVKIVRPLFGPKIFCPKKLLVQKNFGSTKTFGSVKNFWLKRLWSEVQQRFSSGEIVIFRQRMIMIISPPPQDNLGKSYGYLTKFLRSAQKIIVAKINMPIGQRSIFLHLLFVLLQTPPIYSEGHLVTQIKATQFRFLKEPVC